MTYYLVRRVDGQYLVRDDEFTPNRNEACHFSTRYDAQLGLEKGETIERVGVGKAKDENTRANQTGQARYQAGGTRG